MGVTKMFPLNFVGNLYKGKENVYSAKLLPVLPNAIHQDKSHNLNLKNNITSGKLHGFGYNTVPMYL